MKRKHKPDNERPGRPWEHPYPEAKPRTLEAYQSMIPLNEKSLVPMVPDKMNTTALLTSLEAVKYPVLVTPKVRGVRCLTMTDGEPVDGELHSISNQWISETLKVYGMGGLDGVITIRDEYDKRDIKEQVSDPHAAPEFEYHVFDLWCETLMEYDDRIAELVRILPKPRPGMIKVLRPADVRDVDGLVAYWNKCVDEGYDGVMVRQPDGMYTQHGQPAPLGMLDDLSVHATDKATIVGSIGTDTLDAFMVKDSGGREFTVRCGYTQQQRDMYWKLRRQHIGFDLTYRYNPGGRMPRNCVFIKTTAR